LAITSPTSGGRSIGIVRSRTQTLEFTFSFFKFLASGRGTNTKVKAGISGKMFILNVDKFLFLNSILLLANVLS
jgi:hypothetical protein